MIALCDIFLKTFFSSPFLFFEFLSASVLPSFPSPLLSPYLILPLTFTSSQLPSYLSNSLLITTAQIRRRILDMADKERHALGHGSQRWIVKEEVRAKAGLELAEAIFTPKRAKKPAAPTAAVSSSSSAVTTASASASATASASASASSSVVSSTNNLNASAATASTVTDTAETMNADTETTLVPLPLTETKAAVSPVKKVPSSAHRTPSIGSSSAGGKSSSLLRFFNKPAVAEKNTVIVPVPAPVPTPDRQTTIDMTSGGETVQREVEKEEEDGKKEEKTAARKTPILIVVEDSNQSVVPSL